MYIFLLWYPTLKKIKSTLNFIQHQLENLKEVSEGTDNIIEIESFPSTSDEEPSIIEQNVTDENYFNKLITQTKLLILN